MTAGIWIAPLAVTGLAAILWVATRLEQLVAPRLSDPGPSPLGGTGPSPVDAGRSQVVVDNAAVGGRERAAA